ncbi:hypothetical protein GGE48_000659 [Rhizobium leguminosarum]|nr:hypothetical protein [Rhizobium leguminosarum]
MFLHRRTERPIVFTGLAGNRHPRYRRFRAFQLNSTAGSWFQIIGRNPSTRPAEGVGRSCCRDSRRRLVGAIFDRSLDGKFRVSVVATGLEGSPLPASAPHAAEQIQTRTLQ